MYQLQLRINPTVLTLGHIIPAHVQDMKMLYGIGLGINSMEGREAKHVFISKYSANTLYLYRWEKIFRDEYMTLIRLRQKGYNISNTHTQSSNQTYILKGAGSSGMRYCRLEKSDTLRNHPLRKKIESSISTGCINFDLSL